MPVYSASVDATVSPLTDTEAAFIEAQLAAAAQFLADYGSSHNGTGLEGLDHAWASWLDRQQVDPSDPEPVINAVGVYLGQSLVEALTDFTWVVAIDPEGRTLAVHGLPGTADLLIYPADVVGRRYFDRTAFFLRAVHDEIVAEAARLRG